MNKIFNKISKKNLIYIVILSICIISALGMGVIDNNKTHKNLNLYNKLTLSTFGDSVTAQGKWQPYVVSKLNFSKNNNNGINGTKVSGNLGNAMWQDARINAISKKSNVILFMGGTNDWLHDVPLGILGSSDTNTFYGALNVISNKLLSRFPNSKIVFMSTTFAMAPSRSNFKNKTGIVNNIGLMNIDYGMATQRVAMQKNISFINLTSCGIDRDNIANYMTYDGSYIHPNTKGAKKIALVIVSRLQELETTK